MLRIRSAFSNNEENFATRFVRSLGCEVISRNSRAYGAEVDILCKDCASGDYLLFEVKRRAAGAAALYPAVSRAQLLRLKKTAEQMQLSADRLLTIRVCLLLVNLARGSVELVPDVVGAL